MNICLRILLAAFACFTLSTYALAVDDEEIKIRNAGMIRTVAYSSKLLRTTKIEANGTQMLDKPSVEFLIDVERKGENISLAPSDFEVKGIDSFTIGNEKQIFVELHALDESLPLVVYVDYFMIPKENYQQKSIKIAPCRAAADVTLKRVVVDSLRLKDEFVPVSLAVDNAAADDLGSKFKFDERSNFGAIDPKTKRALYFGMQALNCNSSYTTNHYLTMSEDANVLLKNGYQTSRVTIGAMVCTADVLYKRHREMMLDGYYAKSNKSKEYQALKKKYKQYFDVSRYIIADPTRKNIETQLHVIDNKGFMIVVNRGNEAEKIALPLDKPELKLAGSLKLLDWSKLDLPVDMGNVAAGDKVEIEVPPASVKIIGVNIES